MSKYSAFGLKFLAVVLLFVSPAVSHADSISENFEGVTPTLNILSGSSVGSFTVTSGNVDVVGGALFGSLCAAPESGNCVDLDGSSQGAISSAPLSLAAGTYDLSFDLIGSQRGVTTETDVTLGSLYDATFILDSGDVTSGIVNTTFTVASPITVSLDFISATSGDAGALLDNVSLTQEQPTNTPEPGTFVLMALGLAGLLVIGRRFTAVGAGSEA